MASTLPDAPVTTVEYDGRWPEPERIEARRVATGS